ncbi:choline dehydrogenase-like flavoprotein [Prauserella shujinwangii]|uniref:Choline dehydrogenase-like flavoprotein n=1 Tax=Prauserella shujinwangii TaxID=1453103 RepID=A0A2T0LTT4_9PSEU|nr:GMC oxidoreductase [Prauserella shujinwangii]PRX47135.1 choline dehydrogenase-like flavoprotein [Prauserella shujinwangii]
MRDVIVIGAGGGGPVVAKELAAQGLDVLVLEAGPRHADPRAQWTSFENDANNPLTGYFRLGPTDRSKPAWFREWSQNSFVWQLSGVGGTTQHFYGNYPRAYPGVFSGYEGPDRNEYDIEHRFPFSYAEMVPYFEWVEATAPVMTAAMGTKEAVFFRGCETLGLPVQTTKTTTGPSYRPQENAILQPGGNAGRTTDRDLLAYPQATGCTFCGYCFQGCMRPVGAPRNQFAKRSTDNSYVPMALTADVWAPGGRPVDLVTDAFVTRIHTERRGGALTATGVTWRDNASGAEHREDARVVVMAGGCTENPRLWFNSGLPNPNDWVGRGYTDHFFDWVIGAFDDDTGNPKGVGSSARLDFPPYGGLENVGLPPALNAFSTTLSDSGIRGQYTNGRGPTGPWDGPAGRVMGPELKELVAGGLDRLLSVLVITDDDVERDNRVTLSALPADENGPIPKISFRHRARTARTTRNREFMARKAAELLRGAGARKVYRIDWAPLILHVQSSMRMGESERNSVLDANAESRAVRRLFIADNSALPNALGGPNPTLTTQALATRTAEKIFQRYFGGDPWVATGAPVVSTDPRISVRLGELGL